MTKTKQALAWIAQGKPYKQMAADLGLTQKELSMLMTNLRNRGYIEIVPVTYRLTEKGKERNEFVPKTPPEILALHRRIYRMTVEHESSEKIVAHARRSQPNSVFKLGAQP